jgi:hypothetical protein
MVIKIQFFGGFAGISGIIFWSKCQMMMVCVAAEPSSMSLESWELKSNADRPQYALGLIEYTSY